MKILLCLSLLLPGCGFRPLVLQIHPEYAMPLQTGHPVASRPES